MDSSYHASHTKHTYIDSEEVADANGNEKLSKADGSRAVQIGFVEQLSHLLIAELLVVADGVECGA